MGERIDLLKCIVNLEMALDEACERLAEFSDKSADELKKEFLNYE